MLSLSKIDEIHARLGKRASIPKYLQALHQVGVMKYDSYISDGHSEYYGEASE